MKKGPLNFLGRKNQSLFDTNVKMKDMDNVEWTLQSSAIPESGTASVRARPTVKHHSSSSDSFQGFAVPTPKVPVLPPVNGPKTNGSVGGGQWYNGSVISVPDLVEDEIFVPPPPSTAPPPPPGAFFPPPPDFMGDLSTLGLAAPQPPSMPAPMAPSVEEDDLSFLQPPPMAPPKPPSTGSVGSASPAPISSPPPGKAPERPSFAPPQPPNERQHKTHKTPPAKPIRLSSFPTLDSPPQSPAPPPPVQTPTLSTFNPQNTAKLYNVPKTSVLGGYEGMSDTKPKQMLVLQDTGPVKSGQVDGKAPKVATLPKPVSKDVRELKESLQITQPSQLRAPEPKKESRTAQSDIVKSLLSPHKSPKLQQTNSTHANLEPSKDEYEGSLSGKFSPLLDRKLRNLKNSETNGARDGPVASPLALLMAAKEREKHRTFHSQPQEDSTKRNGQPSSSIHPSNTSPNSFLVIPRSGSTSSVTSAEERLYDSPKSVRPAEYTQNIQTPQESSRPALLKDPTPSTSPALSRITAPASPAVSNLAVQNQNAVQSPSKSQFEQHEDNKEELNMPLLPPPPEFDDLDGIMEPPPSILPPDPPMKKAPTPTMTRLAPPPAPSPPPKFIPPAPPNLPPPDIDLKPKPKVQTKPKSAPSHLPANLSPSQVTLLSILQKKMLEMDHKMAPMKEAESSSDDWGTPFSDEDDKIPVLPRTRPQTTNYPVVNKATTLDMRELEKKVGKQYPETSSVKAPTSNGPHSKHQYGMTFTVRPGTKQPITLVSRGEP